MTIKFVCGCGKHLKARDGMASQRAVCPRCGALVGIPSLQPTHPGGLAPMTPIERLRHARNRGPAPAESITAQEEGPPAAAPPPFESRQVRLLSGRGKGRSEVAEQRLETHWYECLQYPLSAWRLCLGLALVLTVLGAWMAVFLPRMLAQPPADTAALVVFYVCCALVLVLFVGLPCSFLECVLASAAAGEVYYLRWSGNPFLTVLFSGAKWLACFLAGPIVYAGAGWLYWLRCGETGLVDWLILTELGLVTIGWWVYALLAVTDRGRLLDLNPLAVADLAHRLGRRGLVAVLACALLLLPHALALTAGLTEVHRDTFKGGVILAGVWASAVFWGTFFCRLLGVWCHRSRCPPEGEPAYQPSLELPPH